MQRWEYYQDVGLMPPELNKLGTEGWELVSIIDGERWCYTFKRPYRLQMSPIPFTDPSLPVNILKEKVYD